MRAQLLFLSVALVALASLSQTHAVSAHSRPVRFDPAPGEVLSAAPDSVTGWFTSDIRRAEGSFIQVTGPDGGHVQTGDIELSEDRRQISTALQAGLGEGAYLVHWSSFDDADGDVLSGCYTFFVGQAAADAAVESGRALDGGADCPASAAEETDAHEDGDSHDEEAGASNTPSIEISIPETVTGSEATLTILPSNFTARAPDGNTVDPNFGHYHIYLDKVPVEVLSGDDSHNEGDHDDTSSDDEEMSEDEMEELDHMDDEVAHPSGLVENPIMWLEDSYTFTNLSPGIHTVTVVLNHDNHMPFNPPVIATQSFIVEGGGSGDDGGIPVWALAIGIAGGLVAGGAGMKLMAGRA